MTANTLPLQLSA